jgi:hypothetical protein
MATVTNDPIALMQRYAHRETVRYAASTAISCPDCGDILDQSRTVVVEGPSPTGPRTAVRCARCWGRAPMVFDDGRWSVLDGRILFAPPPRAPRAPRTRRSAR